MNSPWPMDQIVRELATCRHPYDDVETSFYGIQYTDGKHTPYALPTSRCKRCGAVRRKGALCWELSTLVSKLVEIFDRKVPK